MRAFCNFFVVRQSFLSGTKCWMSLKSCFPLWSVPPESWEVCFALMLTPDSTGHFTGSQAVAWVWVPRELCTIWFWNVLASQEKPNSAPRISEEPWESRINQRLFRFQHFTLGQPFFSVYLKGPCWECFSISGAVLLSLGTELSLMQNSIAHRWVLHKSLCGTSLLGFSQAKACSLSIWGIRAGMNCTSFRISCHLVLFHFME